MNNTEQNEAVKYKEAYPWRFVTPLYLGSTLNPINSSVIATALVPIAAGLHIDIARTVALVSALYLAGCIAQPTAGKLAEEFGPRRIFIAGVLTVLAGALIGGHGSSLPVLIVARILIGLGTSAGYPTAMLMIRRRAQEAGLKAPPGNVLGGLQIAGTVTAALGLPIGGVLVGTAAGLLRTFAYIGSIASSALIRVAFRAGVGDHGLHTIALFMIAVSLLALILTLTDKQLVSRNIDSHTKI